MVPEDVQLRWRHLRNRFHEHYFRGDEPLFSKIADSKRMGTAIRLDYRHIRKLDSLRPKLSKTLYFRNRGEVMEKRGLS